MLIKQKIIAALAASTVLAFLSICFVIYFLYSKNREELIRERLKFKTNATEEFFDINDKVSERAIQTLNDQHETVYTEDGQLVFSSDSLFNFQPHTVFFQEVIKIKEYYFKFQNPNHTYLNDGYARVFSKHQNKFIVIVSAYDDYGYKGLEELKKILFYVSLFFSIATVIIFAFIIKRIISPLEVLVHEIENIEIESLNFRLKQRKGKDEISFIINAFNKLLNKVENTLGNQREFLSHASHELRTPLTVIKGILQTSAEYNTNVEIFKTDISKAVTELNKIIELSNGLLKISQLENIDQGVEFKELNIIDIILDVMQDYQKQFQEQQIDLSISEGFTIAHQNSISGNTVLLKTALYNLVDNASKYSMKRKIEIKVEMNTNKKIRLLICDKGEGIDISEINKVFVPLMRGKNAAGKSGFGVGLALTKKIISIHKGTIDILSTSDKGTAFEVNLPVHLY